MLVFRAHPVDEALAAKSRKVRDLLHLNLEAEEFSLTLGAIPENDKQIAMLTRSMLEILGESSAGVEIPPSDLDEGRVTKRTPLTPLDSELGSRFAIHVRSSVSKPEAGEAFTAVHYRNHWFWVDDRDVPSKRSLGFLILLFTLVETGPSVPPPALTISKP